jgi:hypothetical protein
MTSTITTAPRAPRYSAPNIGVPNVLNLRGLRFMTAGTGDEGGSGAAGGGAGSGEGGDKSGNGGYTPPATQADLDAIIEKRLARVRQTYADHDDLKAKAARLDELEAASASDLDKAVKKAREEATAETTAKTNALLVSAELRALAAAAKFRNPADVVALLGADKVAAVKVNADGTIDGAAAKVLVDDLAKERPYLVDDGAAQQHGIVPGAGATDAGKQATQPAPGMGSLRAAYAESSTKK